MSTFCPCLTDIDCFGRSVHLHNYGQAGCKPLSACRSNILAYFSITQEAVKTMPDRGAVINICSIQAVMPMPGQQHLQLQLLGLQ